MASELKRPIGIDVLTAARQRIAYCFDNFPKLCVSFSGGKDSTVMTHLVLDEAMQRNRKVGLLFIDLEAQYTCTVEHIEQMYDLYADHIEPFWVSLPMILRNAVSQFDPRWLCWDPEARGVWVREPSRWSITDESRFPFFRRGMEFEEFAEEFARWYSDGDLLCSFVGIRSDESLNRFRALAMDRKSRMDGHRWTSWKGSGCWNAYPIYDWKTADLWTYFAKSAKPYNKLYDLMHQAGLSVHEMRICQPYGDDQRKGLWLYHIIEPDTWGRVVARVNGANSGALYAQESGNILGRLKVSKPENHSWESYAELLLESMPKHMAEHYRNKIAQFIAWWRKKGIDPIPDEAPVDDEAGKRLPSWRRVCKSLLRHDYWCKGLSFSQTKSQAYDRYVKIMAKRRQKWGIFA